MRIYQSTVAVVTFQPNEFPRPSFFRYGVLHSERRLKEHFLTTIMASATKAKMNGAVHLHELQVVDYARLKARDGKEIEKLLENARAPGAFYLDLRDDRQGAEILKEIETVYQLTEAYFDQLPAWKLDDVRNDQKPSQDRGYVNGPAARVPRGRC